MPARDLPRVSDLIEPNTRAPLSRVIEEVQKLLGFRGDPQDKAITMGAAMRLGWIDSPPVSAGPGGGSGGGGGGGGGTTPDLTPPPTATGLAVAGGFSSVIVQWDAATYTTGHGPGQTNIYAVKRDLAALGTLPVFGDANRVATVYGAGNITALPSELNTRWYVWIKFQSADGVEATAPTGGTNGVQADTGQDVTQLLQILTGEITESQLYGALGARINLIDGPDSLAGSVAARILAEATARGTAITTEATTRASADTALASSITTLTASVGTNAAAITAEATTRANADTAISSTLTALASTVTSNNSTLTAALATESSTRASSDTALSSSITSLSAIAGSNTAAISAEVSARASLDGAVQALYTVRVETSAAGRVMVGGFGLSATSTASGGPRIDFGIRADRFWVSAPSTATGVPDIVPFTILTAPTVEDGVTFPAGIYMDAAYVRNLSAMVAKIGVAVIDDAKIASLSAAKLTIGDGTIGGNLKSASFAGGSGSTPGTGWLLTPGGSLIASGATIYGTIYASAGVFSGSLSAATGSFAGSLSAATGTFAGSLSAATGTFAGALSGATGSFSGTLSVGSSPAISGTTMTGNGALFNAAGTGVWGTAATNITHDGTRLYINGAVVTAGNISGQLPATVIDRGGLAVSIAGGNLTQSVASGVTFNPGSIGNRTASGSGGTAPYTYLWTLISDGYDNNASVWINGSSAGATVAMSAQCDSGGDAAATLRVTVTDAAGSTATSSFRASIVSLT